MTSLRLRLLYGTRDPEACHEVGSRKNCPPLLSLSIAAASCAILLLAPLHGRAIEQLHSFTSGPDHGGNSQAPLIQGADGALYGTMDYGGTNGYGVVFKLSTNGAGYTVLHSFGGAGDGRTPYGGLVQAQDGLLYGTTKEGGTGGKGTVFKLQADGTGCQVLRSFGAVGGDGQWPYAGLIQGSDGSLYGTTFQGGSNLVGSVFKINTNGSGYAILHSFNTNGVDGQYCPAALMQGMDSALYGVTRIGGTNHLGTVFKLNTDGSDYAVLHNFSSTNGDGLAPGGPALVQDGDGVLYGTTGGGGTAHRGNVFKLDPDGSGYETLYSFTGTGGDGRDPNAGLVLANDGVLYGTTLYGGMGIGVGDGTIFKLNTDGSGYTVLYQFNAPVDGGGTGGALLQGVDGALFGTTGGSGAGEDGTVFKIDTDGSNFTVLYSADPWDGQNPHAGLVQGTDGMLYGTTYAGGNVGYGTVFKINTNGAGYSVLYNFGSLAVDGKNPQTALIQASDGALYGTTTYDNSTGWGTIFKLNPDGTGYTVLHVLSNSEGGYPSGKLLQGSDGALYGEIYGAVYTLNTNGAGFTVLKTLYGLDGSGCSGGLVQGQDGGLYGTTSGGGSTWATNSSGSGTVFRLNMDGSGHTILHNFGVTPGDGIGPVYGLVLSADGTLYGTTYSGGSYSNGVVFKINANGTGYVMLHSFGTDGIYGLYPSAGNLMQASDDVLYGVAFYGGGSGSGHIFRLSTNGTGYAIVHRFTASTGGQNPFGPLIQGTDRALYGTTALGGSLGFGTVFRLLVPPFFNSITSTANHSVSLALSGFPDVNYRIDASSNLLNWLPLTNVSSPNGNIQFTDPAAAGFPRRFYRASWTP